MKELTEAGTYFVVASVAIDYKAPAHYQDKIKITASIEKIGRPSIYFIHSQQENHAFRGVDEQKLL